jgi:serine/threonine-protein phosphatase 2B catalytic subunit
MHRWGGKEAFPALITIFSAPDYCNHKNKGAVILIDKGQMNIKQYKSTPHPFHLPNNQNIFDWSLPFLADKVHDMLLHIIVNHGDEELTEHISTKSSKF